MNKYNKNYNLLLVLVNRLKNNNLIGCIKATSVNKFSRLLKKCNFDVFNYIVNFIGYEFLLDVYIDNINIYNMVETIDKKEGVIGLLMSELKKYPNYGFFLYDKNMFGCEKKCDCVDSEKDCSRHLFRNTLSIGEVSSKIRVPIKISKNKRLWTQTFTLNNKKYLKKLYYITTSRISNLLKNGTYKEKIEILINVINKFVKKDSKFKKLDKCMDFSNFRSNLLKFYRNNNKCYKQVCLKRFKV